MLVLRCYLDWAVGCPDTWANIALGVSVRRISGEAGVGIHGLRNADGAVTSKVVALVWSVESPVGTKGTSREEGGTPPALLL